MRAVAILTTRNEAIHIATTLTDLIAEGLEVILIDHDSTDETWSLARPFLGHGVVAMERLPWTGRFSIREQLEAKRRIIDELDCDWIVHADADEWLTSPIPGQTLLEALQVVDAHGYNAVHFNEFMFVPRRGEDLYRPDYRKYSTRYYFHQPRYPDLQRAWKHRSGLDNYEHSGHLLTGPVDLWPGAFQIRHYIVLSEAQAVTKYVGRTFPSDELVSGLHFDRVGLTAEQLTFPADDAPPMRILPDWASKAFDISQPVTEQYWRWKV